MRKFTALIFLSLFASLSFASGSSYCNGRPTPQAQQSCYVSAVSQKNMQIKKNYAAITSSPKISAQTRAAMDKEMNDWAAWVNSACRNDVCVYNELVRRNNELMRYYMSILIKTASGSHVKTATDSRLNSAACSHLKTVTASHLKTATSGISKYFLNRCSYKPVTAQSKP